MSYRIKHTESETGALRRVLTEQFEKALAAFDDDSVDPHEAIHDCRKRLKKCRAALRLFRSALGDAYAEESTALRDAARRVSAVRDAQALIECFDALEHHFEAQIDETAAAVARQALLDRRAAAEDNFNLPERIDRLRADIESARDRAQSLALSEAGFDAIGPNIKRTYRRGRKAMRAAEENPTAENFHEWRKRAKYHWAHIRLLQDLWPRAREARREEAKRLADLLGDDHDLAVLESALHNDPDDFGGERNVAALSALIDQRSAAIRSEALKLGARLYAEKPGEYRRRLQRLHDAWRSERIPQT